MDKSEEMAANADHEDSEQPGSDRSALYTGRCVGGPFNGRVEQSRFPKGFIVVDKASGMVWIYDYSSPGDTGIHSEFRCREPEGRTLVDEKRVEAALEHDYDVRAR